MLCNCWTENKYRVTRESGILNWHSGIINFNIKLILG